MHQSWPSRPWATHFGAFSSGALPSAHTSTGSAHPPTLLSKILAGCTHEASGRRCKPSTGTQHTRSVLPTGSKCILLPAAGRYWVLMHGPSWASRQFHFHVHSSQTFINHKPRTRVCLGPAFKTAFASQSAVATGARASPMQHDIMPHAV